MAARAQPKATQNSKSNQWCDSRPTTASSSRPQTATRSRPHSASSATRHCGARPQTAPAPAQGNQGNQLRLGPMAKGIMKPPGKDAAALFKNRSNKAKSNSKSPGAAKKGGKPLAKSKSRSPGARRRRRPKPAGLVLTPRKIERACRFLTECRDDLVEAWEYNKAAEINARLEELELRKRGKDNTHLMTQQGSMQHAMMARHVQEMQDCRREWKERMTEYAAWEIAERAFTGRKQQMEHNEHLIEMQKKHDTLHFGKEVVNMRCKTNYLGGCQRYAEAAVMQANADDLQAYEQELFAEKQAEQKASGGEGHFAHHQTVELEGMQTRLAMKRRELETNMKRQVELLRTHQQNERTKMAALHVREQQCASGVRPSSAPTLRRRPDADLTLLRPLTSVIASSSSSSSDSNG